MKLKPLSLAFNFVMIGLLSSCTSPSSLQWENEQQHALKKAAYLFSKGSLKNGPYYQHPESHFSPIEIHRMSEHYLNEIKASDSMSKREISALMDVSNFKRWQSVFNGRPENLPLSIQKKINQSRKKKALPLLDGKSNLDALLKAMASQRDAHTHYIPATIAEKFNQSMYQYAKGLGISLRDTKRGAEVVSIHPKGPSAEQSSLKMGDVIEAYEADNQNRNSWVQYPFSLSDFSQYMEESLGRKIQLKVIRKNQSLIVSVTPKKFNDNQDEIKLFQEQWEDRPVDRLQLSFLYQSSEDSPSFTQDLAQRLSTDSKRLKVLDMRNCRGGSVEEAADAASLFTSKTPVFQIKGKNNSFEAFENRHSDYVHLNNVQIWIGPRTISACEILAQAIKETHPSTTIIGWPSFGKGTIQNRIPLAESSKDIGEAWVTLYETWGPGKQHSIQENGVLPTCRFEGDPSKLYGERAYPNYLKSSDENPPLPSLLQEIPVYSSPDGFQWNSSENTALPVWRAAGLSAIQGQCSQLHSSPTNPRE